ncbi:D-glycerate dehydrogenase [Mycobacterium sp. Root135]|uniref:2-hydroxyacid dehydrogenase n=1 Tax=Mycobacterium sp. Root135 TaxID=1736457 RepID=UPI0006FA3F2C|nr:D-glycerate dehydrogenase [Mycobacterium sp. Root135]KQY09667.1 D-glycerate dehydrogenase [Mycobacterium sp. Root135]
MAHSPAFLVTYPIPEVGMTALRAAGRVHVPTKPPTPQDLRKLCSSGEFDVVVAQLGDRFDAALLADAKVTGISNYAVGYDNVDVVAATASGIVVGNTPGVLTDATADLAMLLILATARRAVEADHFVRSGKWAGWRPELLLGQDISGATLGLVGFGRIARATATRAAAFGMDVTFCSHPPAGRAVADAEVAALPFPARQVGWPELVETSDFLSVHVPLADSTRHLVDGDVLSSMKPTAMLVNTARGPVVDEAALVSALRNGTIAAAGLDVYENEPHLAPGLTELPNVVLLPHLGSATVQVRDRMADLCAANAIAMAAGHLPPHCVNPAAWQ